MDIDVPSSQSLDTDEVMPLDPFLVKLRQRKDLKRTGIDVEFPVFQNADVKHVCVHPRAISCTRSHTHTRTCTRTRTPRAHVHLTHMCTLTLYSCRHLGAKDVRLACQSIKSCIGTKQSRKCKCDTVITALYMLCGVHVWWSVCMCVILLIVMCNSLSLVILFFCLCLVLELCGSPMLVRAHLVRNY